MMTANINTDQGVKEVEVVASYKYRGVDIFIRIGVSDIGELDATASEWRTGFRITGLDFAGIPEDKEVVKQITEKANEKIDHAIEKGVLESAIEKAKSWRGIINQGEMPQVTP